METSTEKFVLLADLSMITVPEDYRHATQLDSFRSTYRGHFDYYDDGVTGAQFPNPSCVLMPGASLSVRVFGLRVLPGMSAAKLGITEVERCKASVTTIEECITFLNNQKAVCVGAQGASLIWEQKREQLLPGYAIISFDEPKALLKQHNQYYAPYLVRSDEFSDGSGYDFGLESVSGTLGSYDFAFFCINRVT